MLHDYESAIQSLEMAIRCSEEKPEFEPLKERALAAKVDLQKKQA